MKKISRSGMLPILKQLYGSSIQEYFTSFGPGANLLFLNSKEVPEQASKINLAASADTQLSNSVKYFEHPTKYKPESIMLGRALAEASKKHIQNYGQDVVVTTGACPSLGAWATAEAKKTFDDVYLVGLIPRLNGISPDLNKLREEWQHYDMLIYTDIHLQFRSILVGNLGDVLIDIHGGFGAVSEISTALVMRKIVGLYDIGSDHGASSHALNAFENIRYKSHGEVMFANEDPFTLMEQAFAEYRASSSGDRDQLTAMHLYGRRNGSGVRLHINVRPALGSFNSVSQYHFNNQIYPITQRLYDFSVEEVLATFMDSFSSFGPKIAETRKKEQPSMIEVAPTKVLEEVVRKQHEMDKRISDRGGSLFWHHSHIGL